MLERIFGLPRNVFILGLTSFFNDFSSEMIFAVFPAFFTSVLKTGAASLGLVDGVAEAASNFFKLYSGRLSDRIKSRKPLVIAGYALSVASRPFYVLVSTVSGALSLRFLDRVGKGLRDPARDALISFSTPKEELGRSFGYHRAMDTTGAILGPLVAYLILRTFPLHFNAIFVTAFVMGLCAVATLFFIADIAATSPMRSGQTSGAFTLRFKLYLLSVLVLSVGSLPVAVILLKSESLGLLIADIPLFYMVYNVSYALFSLPAGRLSDRLGAPAVIVAGYLCLIAGYAAIALANSAWALALGFLVLGLFPGLTDGVQRSYASQLSDADVRGKGLGWLQAAVGFGALLAGIGGGWLWQTVSPLFAFECAGVIVIIGLVLFVASSLHDIEKRP